MIPPHSPCMSPASLEVIHVRLSGLELRGTLWDPRRFSNLSPGTVDTVPVTDGVILDAIVFRWSSTIPPRA